MSYGSIVWGNNNNKFIKRVSSLQDKAIRTINFASYYDSRNPLYKNIRVLKFEDQIKIQNFLLAHDFFNNNLPDTFNNLFSLVNNSHNRNTRAAAKNHFRPPKVRTSIYGLKSITYQSVTYWNKFNLLFENSSLFNKSKVLCKRIIYNHILNSY